MASGSTSRPRSSTLGSGGSPCRRPERSSPTAGRPSSTPTAIRRASSAAPASAIGCSPIAPPAGASSSSATAKATDTPRAMPTSCSRSDRWSASASTTAGRSTAGPSSPRSTHGSRRCSTPGGPTARYHRRSIRRSSAARRSGRGPLGPASFSAWRGHHPRLDRDLGQPRATVAETVATPARSLRSARLSRSPVAA